MGIELIVEDLERLLRECSEALCDPTLSSFRQVATGIRDLVSERNEAINKILELESIIADKKALVRRLDVAINGISGAAEQASLCDLVSQCERGNPSDLEIVQKALLTADKKSYCSLTFYPDGWEVEVGIEELVNGSDIESLLTWAKQTIGGE